MGKIRKRKVVALFIEVLSLCISTTYLARWHNVSWKGMIALYIVVFVWGVVNYSEGRQDQTDAEREDNE